MPPAGSAEAKYGYFDERAYPSRDIAYNAAGMITAIVEALIQHDQLKYVPAFIVYSLFSALIMHVYQMRSSNQSVVAETQRRLNVCMNAMKEVSKVWLVAKMVHTLFESILGNKVLEERLQKAAGKRHAKDRQSARSSKPPSRPDRQDSNETHKRKFEEMEFGYAGGPPAPQMSYERSRPQSPVGEREQNQQNVQPQGPHVTANTPPPTDNPFNTYSYPGTPPDLFLHTRDSPNISQDLWQNYQPDQLFPPDAVIFPTSSPNQAMVDPALRDQEPQQHVASQYAPQANMGATAMHQQQQQQQQHPQQHQIPPAHLQAANGLQALQQQQPYQHTDAQTWAHLHQMQQQHQQQGRRPEDTWSNSSTSGPIVPTTLNVGDWFEFFGIPNGDMHGLNGGQGQVQPQGQGQY
ncbi:Transcriptional activator of fatty acid utilization [Taxawa tesnikishii (nom. ined.)]|nr:Transcriptional activator of fatty acid utilization [Dothideales sp. JES 119]